MIDLITRQLSQINRTNNQKPPLDQMNELEKNRTIILKNVIKNKNSTSVKEHNNQEKHIIDNLHFTHCQKKTVHSHEEDTLSGIYHQEYHRQN